jgi:hypothetical protein
VRVTDEGGLRGGRQIGRSGLEKAGVGSGQWGVGPSICGLSAATRDDGEWEGRQIGRSKAGVWSGEAGKSRRWNLKRRHWIPDRRSLDTPWLSARPTRDDRGYRAERKPQAGIRDDI